jgi:protein gp37
MSLNSQIEWTDATWNPVRGCTKISPGCKHCYAETFAERFRGVKGHPYEQGFDLKLIPHKLTEPFTWRSPKLVFVNSMSDLFQPGVPDAYIEAVCQVMVTAKWHTFQVLTKRSERLQQLLSGPLRFAAEQDHIWWGVSVEDREYGLPRIANLQKTPARVRFLSIEPLLEDLGSFDLSNISWAIVGGESGPGARPMQKEERPPTRRPYLRRISRPHHLANSRACELPRFCTGMHDFCTRLVTPNLAFHRPAVRSSASRGVGGRIIKMVIIP